MAEIILISSIILSRIWQSQGSLVMSPGGERERETGLQGPGDAERVCISLSLSIPESLLSLHLSLVLSPP